MSECPPQFFSYGNNDCGSVPCKDNNVFLELQAISEPLAMVDENLNASIEDKRIVPGERINCDEGDLVIAKLPINVGRENNPWLAATVQYVTPDGKYYLLFQDPKGHTFESVESRFVRYCPERPVDYGYEDPFKMESKLSSNKEFSKKKKHRNNEVPKACGKERHCPTPNPNFPYVSRFSLDSVNPGRRGICDSCKRCSEHYYIASLCTPWKDTTCRRCRSICPRNFYVKGVCDGSAKHDTTTCEPCTDRCNPGEYVKGTCDAPTLRIDNRTCEKCTEQCDSGYYLKGSCESGTTTWNAVSCEKCKTSCPDGYYLSGNCNGRGKMDTTECVPCTTSCPNDTFLTGECLEKNAPNFSWSKCEKCHEYCGDSRVLASGKLEKITSKLCTGPSASDCATCKYAEDEGKCVISCPSDRPRLLLGKCTAERCEVKGLLPHLVVLNDRKMIKCVPNCPQVTPFSDNGRCVSRCGAMKYPDYENRFCRKCDVECKLGCSGQGPDSCFECKNVKLNEKCVASCPKNTHWNDNGICTRCTVCGGSETKSIAKALQLPVRKQDEYIVKACTPTTDTICGECKVECGQGFYLEGQCTGLAYSDEVSCAKCSSFCGAGQYRATTCDGLSRNDISDCETCAHALNRGLLTKTNQSAKCRIGSFISQMCVGDELFDATKCTNCRLQCKPGEYIKGVCTGTDTSDTTKCEPCITQCPEGYYLVDNCTNSIDAGKSRSDINECIPCHGTSPKGDKCRLGQYISQHCSGNDKGKDPSKCLDCKTTADCAVGQYLDGECSGNGFTDDTQCKSCDEECGHGGCNGSGPFKCVNCKNVQLKNGKCVSKCPQTEPYHEDGVCVSFCTPGVDVNNENECVLKCPLNTPFNDEGVCMEKCRPNFYADKNKTCRKCHDQCNGCTGPGNTECIACKGITNILQVSSSIDVENDGEISNAVHQCVETCPDGRFDDGTGVCSECTICEFGEYISSKCGGQQDTECTSCTTSCLRGQRMSGFCDGTSMKDTIQCISCKRACPVGTYIVGECSGLTREDTVGCVACRNSCPVGQYLVAQCSGTAVGSLHQESQCGLCHSECNGGCTGPSSRECEFCTHVRHGSLGCVAECPPTYFIQSGNCVEECGPRMVIQKRSCVVDCPETSQYFFDGQCEQFCPPGFYADTSNVCQRCHRTCIHNCNGPTSQDCTSPCPETGCVKEKDILSFRAQGTEDLEMKGMNIGSVDIEERDIQKYLTEKVQNIVGLDNNNEVKVKVLRIEEANAKDSVVSQDKESQNRFLSVSNSKEKSDGKKGDYNVRISFSVNNNSSAEAADQILTGISQVQNASNFNGEVTVVNQHGQPASPPVVLAECPSGMFKTKNETGCTPCSISCNEGEFIEKACTSERDIVCKKCTSQCSPGEYKLGECLGYETWNAVSCEKCTTECPEHHYISGTCHDGNDTWDVVQCEPCERACPFNHYRVGEKCDGKGFRNTITCHSCHEECAGSCTGPTAKDCVGCKHFRDDIGNGCVTTCPKERSFIQENKCVESCSHPFVKTGTVVQSEPRSLAGHGPNDKNCYVMCPSDEKMSTKNVCVKACEADEYENNSGQCLKCSSQCRSSCDGEGAWNCSGGCKFVKSGGVCMSRCPNKTFLPGGRSQLTKGLECIDCSTCRIGEYIERPCTHLSDVKCHSCKKSCPEGFYLDGHCTGKSHRDTVECKPCKERCAVGFYLKGKCSGFDNIPTTSCEPCKSSCERGEYMVGICDGRTRDDTIHCVNCEDSCKTIGGYLLKDEEHFCNGTGRKNNACGACHALCKNGCTGPTNNDCNQCRFVKINENNDSFRCEESCRNESTKVFDYNGVCVDECPPHTFQDGSLEHGACLSSCFHESNHGRIYSHQGKCVEECPTGTYGNKSTGFACMTCSDCKVGQFIEQKCNSREDQICRNCQSECLSSQYLTGRCTGKSLVEQQFCLPCHPRCRKGCTGAKMRECHGGCPEGTFADRSGKCHVCSLSCGPNEYVKAECVTSDIVCASCIEEKACSNTERFHQRCDGTSKEDVNECRQIYLRGKNCPHCTGYTSVSVASGAAIGSSRLDAEKKAKMNAKAKALAQAKSNVGFFSGTPESSSNEKNYSKMQTVPTLQLNEKDPHHWRNVEEKVDGNRSDKNFVLQSLLDNRNGSSGNDSDAQIFDTLVNDDDTLDFGKLMREK
eukprot:g4631.t1